MLRSLTLSPTALLFWFVVVNIADALSTKAAMSAGSVEANPFIAWGMESVGTDLALLLKVLVSGAIGLTVIKMGKTHWLKWLIVIFGLIVISNSTQAILL